MKYFLLLVQEMEVKIPAPVCDVVAHAATTATAPPPHSVVLHENGDCELRCFASTVPLTHQAALLHGLLSPLIGFTSHQQPLQHHQPCLLAPLLSACSQKGKHQIMPPTETQPSINEVFVGPVCLCNPAKH